VTAAAQGAVQQHAACRQVGKGGQHRFCQHRLVVKTPIGGRA
jgi:hypothetical protein